MTPADLLDPHALFSVPLAEEHLGAVAGGVPEFDYERFEAQR